MTNTENTKTEKRATFRHRNSATQWAAPDKIFIFWVGQTVVRSWTRQAYQDLICEQGLVIALPTEKGSSALTVLRSDGKVVEWSALECKPYRRLLEVNRNRLRIAADDLSHVLAELDENGHPKA